MLLLESIRPEDGTTLPYQLIKEEREYSPDFQIPQDKKTACFDADKLTEEIHCRKWRTGDTFIPFGMKGRIGERTDNRFRIDETTKRVIIYKIV